MVVWFAHVRVGHRQAPKYKSPGRASVRGFFILDRGPAVHYNGPHVTRRATHAAGRGSAATAGPKGRRPTGLSKVGHRQALNTKNPRRFAVGGFLLLGKSRVLFFGSVCCLIRVSISHWKVVHEKLFPAVLA